MVDTPTTEVETPIIVASSQGITDGLQAFLRYMVVIFGFVNGLALAIGKQDAAAAVTYAQDNLSGVVAAIFGVVSLLTMAYGIYKSFKRGAQIATVAGSDRVPNTIAKLK